MIEVNKHKFMEAGPQEGPVFFYYDSCEFLLNFTTKIRSLFAGYPYWKCGKM